MQLERSLELKHRKGVLSKFTHLGCPALALAIVDGINEGSVVPVLDDIVRSIMDLNFNCVTTIVYQENDGSLTAAQHC